MLKLHLLSWTRTLPVMDLVVHPVAKEYVFFRGQFH